MHELTSVMNWLTELHPRALSAPLSARLCLVVVLVGRMVCLLEVLLYATLLSVSLLLVYLFLFCFIRSTHKLVHIYMCS